MADTFNLLGNPSSSLAPFLGDGWNPVREETAVEIEAANARNEMDIRHEMIQLQQRLADLECDVANMEQRTDTDLEAVAKAKSGRDLMRSQVLQAQGDLNSLGLTGRSTRSRAQIIQQLTTKLPQLLIETNSEITSTHSNATFAIAETCVKREVEAANIENASEKSDSLLSRILAHPLKKFGMPEFDWSFTSFAQGRGWSAWFSDPLASFGHIRIFSFSWVSAPFISGYHAVGNFFNTDVPQLFTSWGNEAWHVAGQLKSAALGGIDAAYEVPVVHTTVTAVGLGADFTESLLTANTKGQGVVYDSKQILKAVGRDVLGLTNRGMNQWALSQEQKVVSAAAALDQRIHNAVTTVNDDITSVLATAHDQVLSAGRALLFLSPTPPPAISVRAANHSGHDILAAAVANHPVAHTALAANKPVHPAIVVKAPSAPYQQAKQAVANIKSTGWNFWESAGAAFTMPTMESALGWAAIAA